MIAVWHSLVSAPVAVRMPGIAAREVTVAVGVGLIDGDYVLVYVLLVGVVEMAVV